MSNAERKLPNDPSPGQQPPQARMRSVPPPANSALMNFLESQRPLPKKMSGAGGALGIAMMSFGLQGIILKPLEILHLTGIVEKLPGGTAFLPIFVMGGVGWVVGFLLEQSMGPQKPR